MIKPDGIQRGLAGEVISRIERRGLNIIALKMVQVEHKTAKRHYAEHADKPFFGSLVDFIMSGPSIAMVIEGRNAISVTRNMVGATDPSKAAAGTIRGDFALDITQNIIHASDSPESADREIAIYFDDEIVSKSLNSP